MVCCMIVNITAGSLIIGHRFPSQLEGITRILYAGQHPAGGLRNKPPKYVLAAPPRAYSLRASAL